MNMQPTLPLGFSNSPTTRPTTPIAGRKILLDRPKFAGDPAADPQAGLAKAEGGFLRRGIEPEKTPQGATPLLREAGTAKTGDWAGRVAHDDSYALRDPIPAGWKQPWAALTAGLARVLGGVGFLNPQLAHPGSRWCAPPQEDNDALSDTWGLPWKALTARLRQATGDFFVGSRWKGLPWGRVAPDDDNYRVASDPSGDWGEGRGGVEFFKGFKGPGPAFAGTLLDRMPRKDTGDNLAGPIFPGKTLCKAAAPDSRRVEWPDA